MNKLVKLLMFISLSFMLACVSSNPAKVASSAKSEEIIDDGYSQKSKRNSTGSSSSLEFKNEVGTLADYLGRVPGVIVQGSGLNAAVKVRGVANSFVGGSSPLFVVNGSRVGNSLATVSNMFNVQDIQRVTVLKDPSDTAIYGTAGSNGVIVIRLKKK